MASGLRRCNHQDGQSPERYRWRNTRGSSVPGRERLSEPLEAVPLQSGVLRQTLQLTANQSGSGDINK